MSRPLRIFISYAHPDERHRKRLDVHLTPLRREGLIEPWHDRMIPAGATTAAEIDRNLDAADIVLLLVSADFIASDYCFEKEMKRALERHAAGAAIVIPIIVAPADFGKTPFAGLKALPQGARPIGTWPNSDEAWLDVARGIRQVVETLALARRTDVPATPSGPGAVSSNPAPAAAAGGVAMQYDLFLAHAAADKARAIDLYRLLLPDVRTFLDCETLVPGDEWDRELPRAQKTSLATVILVSRSADRAWYLRSEIAAAIALHRGHPDEHRAIPVFLDGFPRDPNEVPYGLNVVHGIDAVAEGGASGVAAKLRQVVARLRSLPPAALPAPAPTVTTSPPAPLFDADRVYTNLCKLIDAQFESFLFFSHLPRHEIRPNQAPLALRALDVVMMAQQGGPDQQRAVMAALQKVAPWMA